jgi:hypothetical protein
VRLCVTAANTSAVTTLHLPRFASPGQPIRPPGTRPGLPHETDPVGRAAAVRSVPWPRSQPCFAPGAGMACPVEVLLVLEDADRKPGGSEIDNEHPPAAPVTQPGNFSS